jgi:hypothetical protein
MTRCDIEIRKNKQLIVITAIICTALSSVALFFSHISQANSRNWCDELLSQSKIHVEWSDGQKIDTAQMARVLDEDLVRLQANPWFKGRLPENWGVLIDAHWNLSSGFFSDQLKTSQGLPAVLFSPVALLDEAHVPALLAHELTHLMNEQYRPWEESWVREGLAMMGEWKITGFYSPVLEEGFVRPETSLVAPLDPRDASYARADIRSAQYGQILQYFMYIYRLCGKDALLNELLTSKSKKAGIEFVDEVLKGRGSDSPVCGGFEASFRAFSLARLRQNFLSPEEYIVIAPDRSEVRRQALALPPYSASLYERTRDEPCRPGDPAIDSDRCAEIRLK